MGVSVLVVQHGEKVRGAGDPGLTRTGARQAAAVADWLASQHMDVGSVWASPLRRSQQTAATIAAALGLSVRTDPRLRERMNWDDEVQISLDEFLAEWQRTSEDPTYRPPMGDSSRGAAARFSAALVDICMSAAQGTVVVVAHGGVTVDLLRTLVGDDTINAVCPELIATGVPCAAITRLKVHGDIVSVDSYPSTRHIEEVTPHRPA